MGFIPKLFIGIGATSAFYTLRETYLHEQWVGGRDGYMHREIRSFHHFNLSTDLNNAVAKAEAAAQQMGLPLDADPEKLQCDMRDIKRATAEEMERRRVAYAEQQSIWDAERAAKRAEQLAQIHSGVVSFGKYDGRKFDELTPGYLAWLVSKVSEFEEGSLLRALAETVRDNYAHLLPRQADPSKLIGAPGQRLDLDVEVTRVYTFERPHPVAHWKTESVHIVTMVTSDGACVVSKSTSFCPREGESLRIKATVKTHDGYKGQAQTVVQRIKVIDHEKKAA